MWITPLSVAVSGQTISLDAFSNPVPLPEWYGIPIAIQLEVDEPTLRRVLGAGTEAMLLARDEEGDLVHCQTLVGVEESHTCESDTMLVLLQCGPFEAPEADGDDQLAPHRGALS